MKTYSSSFRMTQAGRQRESGQVMLFALLGLGIFLIGAMAFAIDLSNLWFQRQAAQTAADAVCTAGAMDMLVGATNGTMPTQANFTPGPTNTYDCNSASPLPSPCSYGTLNGFNSSVAHGSTTLGNNVYIDFPSAVPGVTAPPAAITANPFIRATVTNNMPTFFAGMLKGLSTQKIRAVSLCGVVEAQSPIPILVLNPSVSGSLGGNGTPTIAIIGGPTQSIQVNSSSSTAVQFGGTLDLSHGGPNSNGSNFGTFGGPSTPTGTFLPGTAPGVWLYPSTPINDPFAGTPAPPARTTASLPNIGVTVPGGTNGCPEAAPAMCQEFAAGNYDNGIQVKNTTAIFDPGVYYVTLGMSFDSNSCVRPSTAAGDGSGGTVFYFADDNSLSVAANTGKGTHSCPATAFVTARAACPVNPATLPKNLPNTITGSVLLAPCTGQYGDPLVWAAKSAKNPLGDPTADTNGVQRGILFFQNRSIAPPKANQPNYSGGGQFLLAGTMYFHQCVTTGSDTGEGCTPSAFNTIFQLNGNPGATTYILGDIIADQIANKGNPDVTMDLSPTSTYSTLKASLLQ